MTKYETEDLLRDLITLLNEDKFEEAKPIIDQLKADPKHLPVALRQLPRMALVLIATKLTMRP